MPNADIYIICTTATSMTKADIHIKHQTSFVLELPPCPLPTDHWPPSHLNLAFISTATHPPPKNISKSHELQMEL